MKWKTLSFIPGLMIVILSVFFLFSCGAKSEMAEFSTKAFTGDSATDLMEESMAPEGGASAGISRSMDDGIREKEMAALPAEPGAGEERAQSESASVSEPRKEERKRVYSGYAQLLVDNIEKTKMAVTTIADESGGYVENAYSDSITIRVPAEDFTVLFQRVMELGDVLSSHEETVDVSDYYADLETRLAIATQTRARLYALLERTEDVEERIEILREIRRLTEEIEWIELSFGLLKEYIAYSRITLNLISRLEYGGNESREIPFPWIANLHPLYPVSTRLRAAVRGELPDEYAVFRKDNYYRAESADGIRIRFSTLKNRPKGSAEFWQEAIAYNLGMKYARAEKRDVGEFQGALLVSKDAIPYYYYAGVMVDNNQIHLLEVFFPDEELYETRKSILDTVGEELTVR